MVHVYDEPLSYESGTLDSDSITKMNNFYDEINTKYSTRPLKKISFGFKDNTYSDSSSVSFGGNIIDDNPHGCQRDEDRSGSNDVGTRKHRNEKSQIGQ